MSMNDRGQAGREVGQWGTVAVFWIFVGIPLAWGIVETLLKAAQIF